MLSPDSHTDRRRKGGVAGGNNFRVHTLSLSCLIPSALLVRRMAAAGLRSADSVCAADNLETCDLAGRCLSDERVVVRQLVHYGDRPARSDAFVFAVRQQRPRSQPRVLVAGSGGNDRCPAALLAIPYYLLPSVGALRIALGTMGICLQFRLTDSLAAIGFAQQTLAQPGSMDSARANAFPRLAGAAVRAGGVKTASGTSGDREHEALFDSCSRRGNRTGGTHRGTWHGL